MEYEVIEQATGTANTPQNNPLPPMDNINQGTVTIESARAISEAKSKLEIAKAFPRDEVAAWSKVAQSCKRKGFAEKAFFSYPRAGSTVTGVTIKFAQELARCWGNIDYGYKQLSQDNEKTEMQVHAWDMETNTITVQNFVIPHIREVKGGNKMLTSYRDIYENNTNQAARRVRSRILAILPCDLVEMAMAECKKTLEGNNEIPLIDRIKSLVVKFEKLGVTKKQIEERLGRDIETMTMDDLVDYVSIGNSIKEGHTKAVEWFGNQKEATELTELIKNEAGGGNRE